MMSSRLLRVALTGGIATGKSHCLAVFSALGVPVVDADSLARDAVVSGTPGLMAVVARFGSEILEPDGQLNRAALARLVFADAKARHDLEAIIHPIVYEQISHWFESLPHKPGSFAIADVPLLYETHHQHDFDRVIVVSCPPEVQLARLIGRDGLSQPEALQRLDSQWPIADKVARADYVIDTSGTIEQTNEQVVAVAAKLREESA